MHRFDEPDQADNGVEGKSVDPAQIGTGDFRAGAHSNVPTTPLRRLLQAIHRRTARSLKISSRQAFCLQLQREVPE